MTGKKTFPFNGAYRNARVLVTGHTGFKGSWLVVWLKELGANVTGFSLEPPTVPSNFKAVRLGDHLNHIIGDVTDYNSLKSVFRKYEPQIVFHLAAQSIVRHSYRVPRETFVTNVIGTVNLLEAARTTGSVHSVVIITSDKCYEERGLKSGYRENDRLGGNDPYSASKGMAELAAASYIRSFLSSAHTGAGVQDTMGLATARAGNVIGGGDFGEDRLVPDCFRALMDKRPAEVRNPSSIRPWQFVLEPLSGYLLLGARLMENKAVYSSAWNFGPEQQGDVTAAHLADMIVKAWGSGSWKAAVASPDSMPEAETLRLCCDKAKDQLGWSPQYSLDRGISETVAWYKKFQEMGDTGSLFDLCESQIRTYTSEARTGGAAWAG